MSNPFINLQSLVKAQLQTVSTLAVCPILSEDPGDPLNTAYLALFRGALPVNTNGQTGLAALVSLWNGKPSDGDDRITLPMMRLGIRITVFENIPVNRDPAAGTNLSGLDATWAIISGLHGFSFGPGQAPIAFAGFDTESSPTEPILAWNIDFELVTAVSN